MRKHIKNFFCLLITILIVLSSMITTFATTTLTDRTKSDPIIASSSCNYYFINYDTLKYVSADSISSGEKLYQRNYNILVPKFRFVYTRTENGHNYYNIISVDDNTLRLDVKNAVDVNGTNIQFFVNNPSYSSAQEFRFITNSDGTYSIMPRLSSTKVITASSSSDHANIVLSQNTGSSLQKWVVKRDKLVTTFSNSINDDDYSPSRAARYALIQGTSPNFDDFPDTGQNCTNFASQCLYTGNFAMKPENPSILTDREDTDNWFTKKVIGSSFWTSHSWSQASNFYQHMVDNFEMFRTVEYQTGWDALLDFDYICSNITMGDMYQYCDMESIYHSMFIYNKTTCDGNHKGNVDSCPRAGYTELIYAQNVGAQSDNYINGHVYNVILNRLNRGFIFYDVTSFL